MTTVHSEFREATIGRELLAKGVTEAQIRRVQAAQSGKSSSNESRQDYSVRSFIIANYFDYSVALFFTNI